MAHVLLANTLLLPVLLLTVLKCEADAEEPKLSRQKREWIIPPRTLIENTDYRGQVIAKIRSDEQENDTIIYSLEGVGADRNPVGLFTVNSATGDVQVTEILDREKASVYYLLGVAKFRNGAKAEKDIELRFIVADQNDCAPQFIFSPNGEIYESSPEATYILNVTATDDDDPDTLNSKISYSIIQQNPGGNSMFYIKGASGQIYVRLPTLDRETTDSYRLVIKATDLDGDAGGKAATASIVIKILDINDNVPTLEKESYEGSVEENLANVEVIRIKALDKDQVNTDNWLAVFTIESGNEAEYFNITTDPKTNEGILIVKKPLDYEELKELDLKISVSNKAEYHVSTSVLKKTYPIKVKVKNVPEGPIFKPRLKVFNVSEGTETHIHTVIAKYPAIDGDTFEIAKDVRYIKGKDPDNWLIINEKTAEIKLNKLPDRESVFLKNGTYYAEIICMTTTGSHFQSSTGTIALMVEDTNDHCPVLVKMPQTMCTDHNVIYVTAMDNDLEPNGPPFVFTIVPGSTKEALMVEQINDTTVVLRATKSLWPGTYQVALEVRDQQGKACSQAQVVNFQVCTCAKDGICASTREMSSAAFGPSAVALFLLGLLLLLLVPLLLLFCACSSKGHFLDIPFDSSAPLSLGNTEKIGEDKVVPLLQQTIEIDHPLGAIKKQTVTGLGAGFSGMYGTGYVGGFGMGSSHGMAMSTKNYNHLQAERLSREEYWRHNLGNRSQVSVGMAEDAFQGIALSEEFLEDYYSQRASIAPVESDPHIDALLLYDYEGGGSPAGSVGCCSILEADNDLEFLNHLDSKFKTLADICTGKSIEVEGPAPHPKPAPRRSPAPSPAPSLTMAHKGFATAAAGTEARMTGSLHMSSSSSSAALEEQVVSAAATVQQHGAAQQTMVLPTPAYILQPQPVYIATAPRLQTAHYLVDQEAALQGMQGMQGMYMLSDTVKPSGLLAGPLAHDTLSKSGKVVILEQGVRPGQASQINLVPAGTAAAQKVLVVESRQGGAAQDNGGLLARSGTRQEVVFPGDASLLLSEGKSFLLEARQGSPLLGNEAVESQGALSALNQTSSHKLVVQEKVSVTERSVHG
ncbi:desmoglein-2-like protein isoform X1 [Paramormyrops kingsleyae]|uniref:desmoglein-2-like protein isoform X1 n=1 Tax=Paramormyrops kingsleyae TaxID=1676925 RepID=UPI003B96A305